MKRLLLNKLTLLLFIAGIAAFWFFNRKPESEKQMRVISPTTGDIEQKVSLTGFIAPLRMTTITPPYDGYVQKLFVKVGDKVKPNDPIVTIVPKVGDSSDQTFPLRTPFGGSVVQILRSEGEFVKASTDKSVVVRIDDLSTLYIEVDAPEIDYAKVETGMEAIVRATSLGDRDYHAKITDVSRASKLMENWDRARVEFPLRLVILDPDDKLKSGMSAVADIVTRSAKSVLMLPHEFINRDKDGYFVTTAQGEKRKIEVGLSNEEAFEVKSGISESDQVRAVDFLALGSQKPAGMPGPRPRKGG